MWFASARINFAFGAFAFAALGGCASHQPPGSTMMPAEIFPPSAVSGSAEQSSLAARRATTVALEQVGRPYRYGGADPDGFDCSGLVHFSYREAGLQTARTTGKLWTSLRPVQAGSLQPGDVLFFDVDGKVSHVGLYLGDGRFVHAPSSGRNVSVARLDQPFYRQAFVRGGRP